MERFSDWLLKELHNRSMSQSELASLAGLGSGTISNIMNGSRNAGQNTLEKIAKALNIPTAEVFVAAGILPQTNSEEEKEALRVAAMYLSLDDDGREDIKAIMSAKLARINRKNENKSPTR